MRGLAREFDEIGRVDASTEKRVVGNKEISGPYICPLLDEMLWQRMLQRRYKFWAGQEQIASKLQPSQSCCHADIEFRDNLKVLKMVLLAGTVTRSRCCWFP